MGQDVNVWLQGAGFDDHLVPGEEWGQGMLLISLVRVEPQHLHRVISFWVSVPRMSNVFTRPPT